MKLLYAIGIIVLAVLIFSPRPSDDSKNQQAAIELIKKAYRPSLQLLSWNPDFTHASWVASRWGPEICEGHTNCYSVEVWLPTIPGCSAFTGSCEEKRVTAQWFVFDGLTHFSPENAEARMLFVPADLTNNVPGQF